MKFIAYNFLNRNFKIQAQFNQVASENHRVKALRCLVWILDMDWFREDMIKCYLRPTSLPQSW